MIELVRRIQKSISAKKPFRQGQPIVVAVSGGLDSMVLLEVLRAMEAERGWRLVVAHFNHRLRGRSSDADERLVRKRAKELELPCVFGRGDVRKAARREGVSIEMAARRLRHAFLARAARRLGASTIALAHHADDQVELFLVRLLRGAGVEGLAGMKWANPSPADPGIQLVRPLLDCSKDDLRRFAREQEILYREDASNATVDILRNRIRRELLPLLKRRYQPSVNRIIRRVMGILEAESDLVARQAEAWLNGKRMGFGRLDVALQRRVLQQQLHRAGWASDFDLVERLREAADSPFALNPRTRVHRDASGQLHFGEIGAPRPRHRRITARLQGKNGTILFDGLEVRWEILPAGNFRDLIKGAPGEEYFDADKVGSAIVLRHRMPGDRFQPIGMQASVKLQDLFTNQKISLPRRSELAIAATGTGELFWVEGQRMSERFKLDRRTVRTLKWIWRRTYATLVRANGSDLAVGRERLEDG